MYNRLALKLAASTCSSRLGPTMPAFIANRRSLILSPIPIFTTFGISFILLVSLSFLTISPEFPLHLKLFLRPYICPEFANQQANRQKNHKALTGPESQLSSAEPYKYPINTSPMDHRFFRRYSRPQSAKPGRL